MFSRSSLRMFAFRSLIIITTCGFVISAVPAGALSVSDVFPLYYEQPFDSEFFESFYQDLKEQFHDDDMEPIEILFFGLLSYERYLRGLPSALPPIDLPFGWTLEQAEAEDVPFRLSAIEELYNDLVANSDNLSEFELTILYFLDTERSLRNRPRYEFIPPDDFTPSTQSSGENNVLAEFFDDAIGDDEGSLIEWKSGIEELQDLFAAVTTETAYDTASSPVVGSEEPMSADGAPIPEPMTLLLIGAAAGALALRKRFLKI